MSAVTCPPAQSSEPVCRIFPLWKIDTLVEPPPSSTMAQPSSISSGVSTASEAASGSSTNSATWYPARSTHFLQVLQHAREHRDQIDLGLQPRARHADRLVDPALLVDQVVLRDGVQQLVVAPEADVARHVVDPGDVAGPDLVAGDRRPCRASCAPPRARRRCRNRPSPLRRRPYAGRSSSPCRWPGWSLRCREPRRGGCRRCAPTPTPRILAPTSRGVAGDLGDHARPPWSSRGRAPPPAAAAGALMRASRRTITWPAKRPSSSWYVRPCRASACSTAITARMSSAETCAPNQRRRPSTSSTTSGPTRHAALDPREQVGIVFPDPREHPVRPPRRRRPRSEGPGAERSGIEWEHPAARVQQRPARRRGSRAPPGPLPRPDRSRAFPAAAGRTSADAHARHRVRPGAASGAGSSKTLAVGSQLERADHLGRIKILQSGNLHPPDPEEIESRRIGGAADRPERGSTAKS